MSQIDWSKQPKEFPLWLEGFGTHRRHSGWYRRAGEVFEHENEGQFRSVREGQFFAIHERPENSEWTGEGLPPAGTVCDVLNGELSNPEWERCTILYSGKYRVMYDSESCNERVGFIEDLNFRQIRTPEQIAAEVRDKAVEEMLLASNCIGNPWRERFGALYDAGYRKFEIVES